MKAVIHCGTFKTGSTSIQNTAYLNRDYLKKLNLVYPLTGIDARAEKESGEIGYRHSRFIYEYKKQDYPSLLNGLIKEVNNSGCRNLLLSAEPWSNPKAAYSLNTMVQHLKKSGFTEVQGVVFIRNIHDYMVSHYREWVRRHGAYQHFPKYLIAQKYYFDYVSIFKNMKKAFHDNVEFLNYEEVGDVSKYLFNKLEIDSQKLAKAPKTNQGLSCLDVEMFRILNHHGIRISSLPSGKKLLSHFGLSANNEGFCEKLPINFMDVFGEKYIKEFRAVTGMSNTEASAVFENREKPGIDISSISPILEKAIFEWLKQQRS